MVPSLTEKRRAVSRRLRAISRPAARTALSTSGGAVFGGFRAALRRCRHGLAGSRLPVGKWHRRSVEHRGLLPHQADPSGGSGRLPEHARVSGLGHGGRSGRKCISGRKRFRAEVKYRWRDSAVHNENGAERNADGSGGGCRRTRLRHRLVVWAAVSKPRPAPCSKRLPTRLAVPTLLWFSRSEERLVRQERRRRP